MMQENKKPLTAEGEQKFQEICRVTAKGFYFLEGSRMYYSTLSSENFYTYMFRVVQAFQQSNYKEVFTTGAHLLKAPSQDNKEADLIVFFLQDELFTWLDTLSKEQAALWIGTFCQDLIFQLASYALPLKAGNQPSAVNANSLFSNTKKPSNTKLN